MRFEDLPPDAQRRILAAPADLQPLLLATYPDEKTEALARRDEEEREAQRASEELQWLKQLADEMENGVYGPLGVALAKDLLEHGRNYTALSSLRVGMRRLRLQRAVAPVSPAKRSW